MIQNAPDYSQPVEIAEGIYWVGFVDEKSSLHCNPYLIVDGTEAVLIDGGSRPDFSTVMMKILHTGIRPSQIKRLVYQHYDPDLCGSIPHLEEIIGGGELRIISHAENNGFIKHYAAVSPRDCMEALGGRFRFSSGRELTFHRTPYAHSAGSFVTWDAMTRTLFSSDLFGSYDADWQLFLKLDGDCLSCGADGQCARSAKGHCPTKGIVRFHERIMTSNKALRNALDCIGKLPADRIAPQHGSIISGPDIRYVADVLASLNRVGIDGVCAGERNEP